MVRYAEQVLKQVCGRRLWSQEVTHRNMGGSAASSKKSGNAGILKHDVERMLHKNWQIKVPIQTLRGWFRAPLFGAPPVWGAESGSGCRANTYFCCYEQRSS